MKELSKKYLSIKKDVNLLGDSLSMNPKLGDSLGKNCYKVRMDIASKNKGKSCGARVITHLLAKFEDGTLYLLKIYDKNELDTISERELLELLEGI